MLAAAFGLASALPARFVAALAVYLFANVLYTLWLKRVVLADADYGSVKYVERVLDDFGIDFLNENEPAELEVNYLKEAVAGDQIAVTRTQLSACESLNCLVRESDGVDLCVMRIAWRKRS